MLDESFFRMPNLPTPESSGMAPIFTKSITYSKKKNSFSRSKDTFDSSKNMLIFFVLIHYLNDDVVNAMNFKDDINLPSIREEEPITVTEDILDSDKDDIIEEAPNETKELD
ncbi:MAG: hypothetical protein ACLR3R_01420 [Clostridium paraputrificum]